MDNSTQEMNKALAVGEKEEQQVEQALRVLGKRVDLAGSAAYSRALVRKRVIQTAENLLRMVMVYGLTDFSLRMVGLWATVMEWGSLSKNGVRKRLRQCQTWIGMLIVALLVANRLNVPRPNGYHYRLIDVSNVSQPGSHKIDWRLHLDWSPNGMGIEGVQLTDRSQGETLTRWQFQPNDLVLADRIYGVARSLGVLLGAAASFIIRIGWQNLPLTDRAGQPFDIPAWLGVQSTDPAAWPAQASVWVNTPQGRFPLRLIARAIPPEKAAKIRQRLQAEARHKKRKLDERSLLAAGFVMVVSNLPDLAWSAGDILAAYRLRWQIELVFKRLKGLLCFDHLRATDPQLAQVYLLTKVLIALLLGEWQWRLALAAADQDLSSQRPVSQWRVTQLLLETFRQTICGTLTIDKIRKHLPELQRYLSDEPRRRQRQLAAFPDLGMLCGF
jgi:hypothetical protein